MTEIKCNNCGGNQFQNNKEIKDFLECLHCGTQYERKVKEIEDELPLNLKIKISSNMSNFHINNCIIDGNMNNIKGNYNIVRGNMNDIKGIGNIVEGNMNTHKEQKVKLKIKRKGLRR